jgi:hypothetical protein
LRSRLRDYCPGPPREFYSGVDTFAWVKTIAGCAKVKVRGLARVRHHFTLAMAAYNLIRMPRLLAEAT